MYEKKKKERKKMTNIAAESLIHQRVRKTLMISLNHAKGRLTRASSRSSDHNHRFLFYDYLDLVLICVFAYHRPLGL